MALPKLNSALYTLEIPSTKKKVQFRPYLVKEQKALMIAQQSDDMSVMVSTLKSIIKDCILDPIDVDELAIFDIEYIFVQIRSKSTGEVSELEFTCPHCHEFKALIKFDLSSLKVNIPKEHMTKIQLDDNTGIVMKYPGIDLLETINDSNSNDANVIFEIIIDCLDYIFDKTEVYKSTDYTREELTDFFEELNTDQFAKVSDFFNHMPKLSQRVHFKCPKCGKETDSELEGISNFF